MRVIRIKRNNIGSAGLNAAVAVLRAGGVVAFPTETAYGLAADPENPLATAKIFAIKGRSAEKRLPLIAGSAADVRKLVRLTGRLAALADKHWPGPLTIVAPLRRRREEREKGRKGGGGKTDQWSAFTLSPCHSFPLSPTVAIRVPSSAVARRLAAAFGRPVTSTSANISGTPPSYSGAAVRRIFAGRRHQPDLVLDAGRLPPRPPSTIIAVRRGRIKVLRQGAIKIG